MDIENYQRLHTAEWYMGKGQHKEALPYLFRALKILEKGDEDEDELYAGRCCMRIGECFFGVGKPKKGIEFFEKALHFFTEEGWVYSDDAVACCETLANAYKIMGDEEKSKRYLKFAEKYKNYED